MDTENPTLIIDVNKVMTPHIIAPLIDVDVESVHAYLSEFLPEEELSEPIEHRIFERLGF